MIINHLGVHSKHSSMLSCCSRQTSKAAEMGATAMSAPTTAHGTTMHAQRLFEEATDAYRPRKFKHLLKFKLVVKYILCEGFVTFLLLFHFFAFEQLMKQRIFLLLLTNCYFRGMSVAGGGIE